MKEKLKKQFTEYKIILKNIPTIYFALFVVSVILMNLLANKAINFELNWLACDCGIIVSWIAFLTMDTITKHFGPKAATLTSIIASIINLGVAIILLIGSLIPGTWGESFVEGNESIINQALNNTFGGTWYVLLGSTIAFIVSAVVNNFTNHGLRKIFKKNPDGFLAYAFRTYISTAIAQFLDNLCFALIVSHVFFGWTLLQCVVCSIIGMILELIFEIIFSPIGYKISKKWKKDNVGKEYFDYLKEEGANDEGIDNRDC